MDELEEAQEGAIISKLHLCTHADIFLDSEENIKEICAGLRFLITETTPHLQTKYKFLLPYIDMIEKNPNKQSLQPLQQEITKRGIKLQGTINTWNKFLSWKPPTITQRPPSRKSQYMLMVAVGGVLAITAGVIYKLCKK